MTSWNLRNFQNDLSRFISLIDFHGVTGDFQKLRDLQEDLNNKDLVEYEVNDICFYIRGPIAGIQPDNMNYFQLKFSNMLMVKDNLTQDEDPLFGYYLDLFIEAYKTEQNTTKSLCASWHLDRHFNTQNVKYTHPTYHFQFGGKKMELIDEEMSVLSCPRIPHPPMDIFLGFHFLLSNFFNNRSFSFVNSLLNTYEYQQIIKRAQERLWTPYFNGFNPASTHQDFTMNKMFPLYVN